MLGGLRLRGINIFMRADDLACSFYLSVICGNMDHFGYVHAVVFRGDEIYVGLYE